MGIKSKDDYSGTEIFWPKNKKHIPTGMYLLLIEEGGAHRQRSGCYPDVWHVADESGGSLKDVPQYPVDNSALNEVEGLSSFANFSAARRNARK